MKLTLLMALVTSVCHAQEIERNIDRLQGAIDADDWPHAAELSKSLKEKIGAARNGALSAGSANLVDSILSWMPPDVETLVVAQEPFAADKPEGATVYVAGLLGVAEEGALLKRFEHQTVTLAALGARRFGQGGSEDSATGLGMIPYQGCAIYRFSEAITDPLLPRAPERTVAGHPVWESKGRESEGPGEETLSVSTLDPHLLLACNNQQFFDELLARKAKPQPTRALPASLREWSLVDRKSAVWGISHYPNGELLRDLLDVSNGVGTAVSFGKTLISARVISPTNPWEKVAASPDVHGAAKSRQIEADVWELTLPSEGQAADAGVVIFMATLGFVVAV